jgi:phenylpropionate dioxygenase-like ring-hydroxylating dioxygenase large terminal subunit
MYHGLLFDGAGQCVEVPGQRNIPPTCRVTSFPTAERGTLVWVWVGDPALADAALIPIPANLDTGSWQMRHAHCDLNANYMLMNDNLADMSHVAYLHEATFGAGDTRIAQTHPTVTALERGIRIERWLADRERVESWLPDGSRAPTESMQDLWLSYDLIAPGVFVMRTEIHAAGTARSCGYRIPSMPALHSNLNIQAVTPVSSGHSRHFFALGPLAAETVKDTSLPDVMFRIMLRGFEEDRRMLEAQERNLARWPIDPSSAIRHDRGVYLLRQIITRLLALENPAKSVSPSAIPLTAP